MHQPFFTRHRMAGILQILFGLFLAVDGAYPLLWPWLHKPFTWVNGMTIAFGGLLIAAGLYCVCTGTFLSRSYGPIPGDRPPKDPPTAS